MELCKYHNPNYFVAIEANSPYYNFDLGQEVVTEVSGPVLEPSDLKTGDVIHCYFPFNDGSESGKNRWAIVVYDKGMKVVQVSSLDGKTEKVSKYKTNYIIENSHEYGFTKEVFAVGTSVCGIGQVSNIRRVGHIPDQMYRELMKKIALVDKGKYEDPWKFLAWLNKSGIIESIPDDGISNNHNALQSIDDIENSGQANCVDIAMCVRSICAYRGIEHRLVKTSFYANEHKSTGHIYCIFKYSGVLRVFKFMPPKIENGSMISTIQDYRMSNIDEVIRAEERWLKPYHDRINGCNTTVDSYVFTDEDMLFADRCLAERRIQSYMLNGIFGPTSLMKRIVKYDWGCVVNGKKAKDSLENWILNWRLLNHEQFDAVKCGCCWDYVAYEEWYFRENIQALFPTKSWYLETEPITYDDSTNHTWLSYKRGGKVYAFEASWKVYQGIREFNSEKEMIDWYLDKFYGGHDVEESYVVYTYHSKPGMDATKFSKNIFMKGKLVAKKGNHFAYRIKPIIEKDDWTNMGKMWGRN